MYFYHHPSLLYKTGGGVAPFALYSLSPGWHFVYQSHGSRILV